MGVGAASRFLTGNGLHVGCPGLTCCATNTMSGEKPMRDVVLKRFEQPDEIRTFEKGSSCCGWAE